MGTWRASSEAETRLLCRAKSADMADVLVIFMLLEREKDCADGKRCWGE